MGVPCPVVEGEDIKEFKSKVFFNAKQFRDTQVETDTIAAVLRSSRKLLDRDMLFAKSKYEVVKEFIALSPDIFNGEEGFVTHVHIFYKVI